MPNRKQTTMDTLDSFLTVKYRNGYIHTHCNRTTGKVVIQGQVDSELKHFASIKACKQWITKKGLTK